MSQPLGGFHEEEPGSTTGLELWLHEEGTGLEIHISHGDDGLSFCPSREQAWAIAERLTGWADGRHVSREVS